MSVVARSIRWAKNRIQSPSNAPNPSSTNVAKGASTIYQTIGVARVDILFSNGWRLCTKRKMRFVDSTSFQRADSSDSLLVDSTGRIEKHSVWLFGRLP